MRGGNATVCPFNEADSTEKRNRRPDSLLCGIAATLPVTATSCPSSAGGATDWQTHGPQNGQPKIQARSQQQHGDQQSQVICYIFSSHLRIRDEGWQHN